MTCNVFDIDSNPLPHVKSAAPATRNVRYLRGGISGVIISSRTGYICISHSLTSLRIPKIVILIIILSMSGSINVTK
jgi:hypothetical protein